MILSPHCEDLLKVAHPDLARVIHRAATNWHETDTGFIVTSSGRTVAQERIMLAKGASTTMHSRHIIDATGHCYAVDLACTIHGQVNWSVPLYQHLAPIVKAAAVAEHVPIEWGGDWHSFHDYAHFQLPWASYPSK